VVQGSYQPGYYYDADYYDADHVTIRARFGTTTGTAGTIAIVFLKAWNHTPGSYHTDTANIMRNIVKHNVRNPRGAPDRFISE